MSKVFFEFQTKGDNLANLVSEWMAQQTLHL